MARLPTSLDHCVIHVSDWERARKFRVVARFGAQGDGTSVYFRDPHGSLMEFISYHG